MPNHPAPAASVTTPVTVVVEDILPPTTAPLPDALTMLWDVLRVLPLGWTQYEAYRHFLRPGAEERVLAFLERDGELQLSFRLESRVHRVSVHRAGVHPVPVR